MRLPAVLAVSLLAAAPLAAQSAAPAASTSSTRHDATKPALNDPTIVAIFDAANTADIETGNLAARRAQSADVKALARQMASDHRTVRQQGRDLAAKLHVTPTPPTDHTSAEEHAKVMQRLRTTPAAKFDCAYLEHEVAFHKAVIDAVGTSLMPAIQNADLKSFVQQVAPAFQGHMMAAENLAKKHGCEAPASAQ
ncbi:MAG TPA: DUF4142 domain-containing protein [Gemmatimonadales bacterium]|nr:DUF4142 domain-containing protein [Gemmatimonadales bacterium]